MNTLMRKKEDDKMGEVVFGDSLLGIALDIAFLFSVQVSSKIGRQNDGIRFVID